MLKFSFLRKNALILKNYTHLTILQVVNSFFYLIIYPIVIRTIGMDNYGEYVYANSICLLFGLLIGYGFDTHATKIISIHTNKKIIQAELFNEILTSKIILLAAFTPIAIGAIIAIPALYKIKYLLVINYINVLQLLFLTTWYFHGIQKLHIATTIQLITKIISLAAILIFLKSENGVYIYALIVAITNLTSAILLFKKSAKLIGIIPKLSEFNKAIKLMMVVFPYFLSTSLTSIKHRFLEIIIGNLSGTNALAIYDLAYKIFSALSILTSNINAALLPRMAKAKKNIIAIRKIIFLETILGLIFIVFIYIFGDYFIKILIGINSKEASNMLMLLSINILPYLIVGAYCLFIFVPTSKYKIILANQIFSLALFLFVCLAFYSYHWTIYSPVIALVVSGMCEILFCRIEVRRNKTKYEAI